jgi:urease accessory protein
MAKMLELIELIENASVDLEVADTLTLPYDARQKSRQRVELDSGREAAIFLPPSSRLCEGDQLRTSRGEVVGVRAADEPVSTVRSGDPLELARACYHLGNRHVPLQVEAGWLRYQPDHVLDDMLRGLGLTPAREHAAFEPERGAYHDQGSGHAHAPHTHDHGHEHANAHQHGNPHDHTDASRGNQS